MTDVEELANVMNLLRSGHDMLPFMMGLHPASAMQLRPVPGDMRELLEAASDYLPPAPGEGPVWLQIASGNDAAEMVVYRTRASGMLYVAAPDRGA